MRTQNLSYIVLGLVVGAILIILAITVASCPIGLKA